MLDRGSENMFCKGLSSKYFGFADTTASKLLDFAFIAKKNHIQNVSKMAR